MMRAIGLMSGTSMDGVDVALIETDGEGIAVTRSANGFVEALGPTGYRAYSDEDRALLRAALADAEAVTGQADRPGCLAAAEDLVTRIHAEAVEAFLAANGLAAADVAVIGFHGQTVVHRPDQRISVQIGDGAALARRVGVPVVADLRLADVEAGGQGAPLVPVFHRALAEASGFAPPLAILNIGGVANVTLIGSDGALTGFDTGPGNALLDDLMRERGGADYDADGAVAAQGKPDGALVDWLLAHPYFREKPPKSLDRNSFSHRLVGRLALPDAAATLTAFTTRAVLQALDWAPEAPRRWIVAGGGARNGEILRQLRDLLKVEITTADEVGWSGDGLEAQALAYLAMRNLSSLPITFPGTTGAPEPITGGVLARP